MYNIRIIASLYEHTYIFKLSEWTYIKWIAALYTILTSRLVVKKSPKEERYLLLKPGSGRARVIASITTREGILVSHPLRLCGGANYFPHQREWLKDGHQITLPKELVSSFGSKVNVLGTFTYLAKHHNWCMAMKPFHWQMGGSTLSTNCRRATWYIYIYT